MTGAPRIDPGKRPELAYRYQIIEMAEAGRAVFAVCVIHDQTPDWLHIVARFTDKHRADVYCDVEQWTAEDDPEARTELPAPTRGAPVLARRLLPLRRPGEKPKADGCRFIEGEPNGALTVYCEAPLLHPLDSYCAAHHARCYQRKDQADAGKGRGQFVVFGGLSTNGGKVRQVPAAKTLAGVGA